jgi:hypothetical protein
MSALARMAAAQGGGGSSDPRGSRHNGRGTTQRSNNRWGGGFSSSSSGGRAPPPRTFTTTEALDLVAVALGGLRTRAITSPEQNKEILAAVQRVLLTPQRTGRDARESRVEDYRQIRQHIGNVSCGSCKGVVVGEKPTKATAESALATLSAEERAAGDWREIATNDPFYQYFLATQPYRSLVTAKDTFSTNERAWQMRDLPSLSFVGQFYFCMREMDEACGNYYQNPNKARNFIDIGCAPGGFLQCLLDFDPNRSGIGLTLATDTSKGMLFYFEDERAC